MLLCECLRVKGDVRDGTAIREQLIIKIQADIQHISNELSNFLAKVLKVNTFAKKRGEERGRSVVELLSSTTTTQKLQIAHVRHISTLTMPPTADKRHQYAPIKQDNHGNASYEWKSHDVGNFSLGW